MGILAELQRRNVIRMAVAYLVFAWVVMQVLSVVAPILELPGWTQRMVLLLLAVGFVGAARRGRRRRRRARRAPRRSGAPRPHKSP